jgi:TonB-linked SusC/RagA family outer membrane protein
MRSLFTIFILLLGTISFAQNRQITGNVSDEEGNSLPGANVIIKGTADGTITDVNGNYEISVVNDSSVLIFSFIGLEPQEIAVGNSNEISVVLLNLTFMFDEVISVGYGTIKKSDLTGAVATIKSEDILKNGAISLDGALAGKAAGVIVTQGSGVPGSGASIKIRGINSMRGSEPLYIIDGVAMDNTSISSLSEESEASSNISPLSSINPSDIQSIEILKDASATAIYGSRGANGVVLISTKSGKSGKGRIEVDAEYGISELPKQISLLDANDYWLTKNEAEVNSNSVISTSPERLDSARQGSLKSNNWQDAIFRQGSSQNYNVRFSGGTEDLRYLVSSNFYQAQGIVKKTDFQRVSTRVNLDAKINDWFSMGTRLYYAGINSTQRSTTTNFNVNSGTNSVIMRALLTSPSAGLNAGSDDEGVVYYTPTDALEANTYENFISQFLGNMFVKVNILDGLVFKTDLSYQHRSPNQRFYQQNILPIAYSRGGWSKTSDSRIRTYSITNTLSYNKNISDHNINTVLGQSAEMFDYNSISTSNFGYANDLLEWYAPQTALFSDPEIVKFQKTSLLSYFLRANYSYKNKFLFTITGRADGSSRFAENNKWAFFPAVAVGYNLSQEEFIKNMTTLNVSNLKLRVSYGTSGNQAVSPYQSLSQLASDKQSFGNGAGGEAFSPIYYTSQLPNKNLQWEKTAQLNAGIDIGILDDRISATVDYFQKETDNLLVSGNRIPSQSGFTVFTENMGKMTSNGIEFGFNAHLVSGKDFKWQLGATFSTGKTTIKEMGADYILSGYNQGWVAGGTQRLIIGEEIGAFYGYSTNGISQFSDFVEFDGLSTQEQIDLYNTDLLAVYTPVTDGDGAGGVIAERPGQQLYEDKNNDGVINELDRDVIGYAQPDGVFGISNNFTYKNFDLSIFVDGQYGQDICNVTNFKLFAFANSQQLAEVKERWTPENPSDTYPRLDALNFGAPGFKMSDRFLEKGAFVRLQNITLSYRIPKALSSKLKINNAKVYVSGSNLLLISDYTGYSPDVSLTGNNTQMMGHDNAGYPVARSIRFGINLKL